MWRIDELFTTWPLLGSRRMTSMLRHAINRKRVRKLAQDRDYGAGLEAVPEQARLGTK
jgi:hypothetical protein